jgi:hypothetical protein
MCNDALPGLFAFRLVFNLVTTHCQIHQTAVSITTHILVKRDLQWPAHPAGISWTRREARIQFLPIATSHTTRSPSSRDKRSWPSISNHYHVIGQTGLIYGAVNRVGPIRHISLKMCVTSYFQICFPPTHRSNPIYNLHCQIRSSPLQYTVKPNH